VRGAPEPSFTLSPVGRGSGPGYRWKRQPVGALSPPTRPGKCAAAARGRCPACGAALRRKGRHRAQLRTLFGTVPLTGPRRFRCRCAPHPKASATFSPLAELLPEHVAPERLYLEAKWAALVSYGLTARLLADVLPLDDPGGATTVRHRLHRVAARAEAALGDERWSFIEGCPAEWAALPRPPAPLTVGLDGGYVRGWADKRSHFEVIVGKAVPEEGRATCFGFVPGRDAKSWLPNRVGRCAVVLARGTRTPRQR
jgi:hypothetical protein